MKQILPILLIFFIITGCRTETKHAVTRTEAMMDTVVRLTIYHEDKAQAEHTIQDALDYLEIMNTQLSMFDPDSDIYKVNIEAGQEAVPVHDETYKLVDLALDLGRETNGAFNIAIGAVSFEWSEAFREKVPPNDLRVDLVDLSAVQLNDGMIYLEKPDMMLDLGGIAKGYLADRVANFLASKEIEHAVINLGGNVVVMGSAPTDGRDWRVGIQNPFESGGDIVGEIQLSDGAVVTSGIYQRYFEREGKLYHHLLNPQTGRPIDNELVAVTVVSSDSAVADALATAIFVMGLEAGYDFIEDYDQTEAVFVTKDRGVYVTPGLESFRLTHADYHLEENP